jgi:hypothetical protein
MSEWLDSQNKAKSNFQKLLKERIEKENPRRQLNTEEDKRLAKLEGIAVKLKRGEHVQNRQLQTWLSDKEYEQLEYEWQEQLELRSELRMSEFESGFNEVLNPTTKLVKKRQQNEKKND